MTTKTAELKKCRYRSIGPNLIVSVLEVEFELDGEIYTHQLPNQGWDYQNPALQFMGYVGIQPSMVEGTSIELEGQVEVSYNENRGPWLITQQTLVEGLEKLSEASWFSDEGDVWDGGKSMAFGGMSVDPSTGNRAAVEIDG